MAVSPDGGTAYSASSDGTVFVWDLEGDRRLGRPIDVRGGPYTNPLVDLAGTLLAASRGGASGGRGGVDIWDLLTRSRIAALSDEHAGNIWGVALSPDGRLLVTTGDDGKVRLWDVKKASMIGGPMPGTRGLGWVAAFSSDGRMFATGGDNVPCVTYDNAGYCTYSSRVASLTSSFIVWDTRTRQPLHTFKLAGSPITPSGIAISPDGRYLAGVTSSAATLLPERAVVWEVSSGRVVVSARPNSAASVTFARDGRTVAFGNTDGT